MEIQTDFKILENQMEMTYINNLIKMCEKNNINKDMLIEKIKKLQQGKNQSNESSDTVDTVDTIDAVSESHSSIKQYDDNYLYQKQWAKMAPIHKIIKIKEFINSLQINDSNQKQQLKDKLIEMVKNKTLTKKNSVEYDSINAKIINIPILQFKDEHYFI